MRVVSCQDAAEISRSKGKAEYNIQVLQDAAVVTRLSDDVLCGTLRYLLGLQNFCYTFSKQQHRVPIVQPL